MAEGQCGSIARPPPNANASNRFMRQLHADAIPSRAAVRRVALARAISAAGNASAFVALSAVLYASTGSAVWVSAAALASYAPPALISPLAGAIGDRRDRRRVMVISDLLGSGCLVLMALVSGPAALVGVRVLAATVAAPLVPAAGAALPGLAPAGEIGWANSHLATAGTLGALVGPVVGGLLVAGSGASLVFVLNACCFLVSALLVLSIRGPFGEVDDAENSAGTERGLASGFAFLVRHRELRAVTIAFGLIFLGIGLTLPAEVALATDFGVGAAGYGVLMALWGVGAAVGAQLASGLLRHWRSLPLLTFSACGIALALWGIGAAPIFALALTAMGIAGFAEGVWEVAQQVLIQSCAPNTIRSRVLAANEAISQVGFSVATLFAGLLINALGPRPGYYIAGVICGLGALVLAVATYLSGHQAGASGSARPKREGQVGFQSGTDGR